MASTKQHIFFSYDAENKIDTLAAEAIKKQLLGQKLRIYQPKNEEDLNISIAKGIEQAAILLIFPSPTLQKSRSGSKILNYADQRKTPILTIQHLPNFQPTEWLGAILAATKKSSVNFAELFAAMSKLVNMAELSLKMNETIIICEKGEKKTWWTYSWESGGIVEVPKSKLPKDSEEKEILFNGASDAGNLRAHYEQYGEKHEMKFKFFGLEAGRIFGHGDDNVGSFTLNGSFTEFEMTDGEFSFIKKYIGQHEVLYDGTIGYQAVGKCVLEGFWTIAQSSDSFSIELDLKQKSNPNRREVQSNRHFATKVLISYCASQQAFAQKITSALIEKGIDTICPNHAMSVMIEEASSQAKVVIPLMSQEYESSTDCKYVLSYVDEVGIPIVPIKAQDTYNQSGWLGVICAGDLWIQMTKETDISPQITELLNQLLPITSAATNKQDHIEDLADRNNAQGYYIQYNKKHNMNFKMFAMAKGVISGHGDDSIGEFVIHGQYYPNGKNFDFHFKKHYLGQHDVMYSGTTSQSDNQYILNGEWSIDNIRDKFCLTIAGKPRNSSNIGHVMLSYNWNSQILVKRAADMLKKRNIPIWLDIDGGMQGNINASMANGVEKAVIVLSFLTTAYSKSVNCQKEITYAAQLKKEIVPVLLEKADTFNDTWLSNIIASLNKISVDPAQFDDNFNQIVTQIDDLLKQKTMQNENLKGKVVRTLFEGGSVNGKYYQNGKGYDMSFEHFSLRDGRVAGQGSDKVGHFTLAGEYDSDGNVQFNKQYVGKHLVEYSGTLYNDKNDGFKMEGKWDIPSCSLSDKFYIKNK